MAKLVFISTANRLQRTSDDLGTTLALALLRPLGGKIFSHCNHCHCFLAAPPGAAAALPPTALLSSFLPVTLLLWLLFGRLLSPDTDADTDPMPVVLTPLAVVRRSEAIRSDFQA